MIWFSLWDCLLHTEKVPQQERSRFLTWRMLLTGCQASSLVGTYSIIRDEELVGCYQVHIYKEPWMYIISMALPDGPTKTGATTKKSRMKARVNLEKTINLSTSQLEALDYHSLQLNRKTWNGNVLGKHHHRAHDDHHHAHDDYHDHDDHHRDHDHHHHRAEQLGCPTRVADNISMLSSLTYVRWAFARCCNTIEHLIRHLHHQLNLYNPHSRRSWHDGQDPNFLCIHYHGLMQHCQDGRNGSIWVDLHCSDVQIKKIKSST